nr:keratin, type II cytoskeletal 1-like [Plodia interpunctella]
MIKLKTQFELSTAKMSHLQVIFASVAIFFMVSHISGIDAAPQFGGFANANAQANAGRFGGGYGPGQYYQPGFGARRFGPGGGFGQGGYGQGGYGQGGYGQGGYGQRGFGQGGSLSISKSISISRGGGGASQSSANAASRGK